MYAFVNQKVFLGKGRQVKAISFDPLSNLVALGFKSGNIKILQFQNQQEDEIDLLMNTNLKHSHLNEIKILSWNSQHEKLLSLDHMGLMIVWTELDETFEEEMINESQENKIIHTQWSKEGNYIIIILESGNVILGNVKGDRIWNIELKMNISYCDWLENDNTIVLSNSKGELIAIDTKSSEKFAEYDVASEQMDIESENKQKIVIFEGNSLKEENSRLVISYETGQIYLIHNLREQDMRKLEFGFDQILSGKWNKQGNKFAVSVIMQEVNSIYLFDINGKIVTCFQAPHEIYHMDFNSQSDKLILAVDNNLFLSQIKNNYEYQFLNKKNIFIFKKENNIYFYEMKTGKMFKKKYENIILFESNNEDKIVIVQKLQQFKITILNYNGSYFNSIKIQYEIQKIKYHNQIILITVNDYLLIWKFKKNEFNFNEFDLFLMNLNKSKDILDIKQNREFIIDDQKTIIDQIDITDRYFYICNEKGFIKKFDINDFNEKKSFVFQQKSFQMKFSKNDKFCAIIDYQKNLFIYKISKELNQKEVIFQASEVWDLQWNENSEDFYFMSKNKLYQANVSQNNIFKNMKFDQMEKFLIGINFPNLITFDIDLFDQVIDGYIDIKSEQDNLYEEVILKKIKDIQIQIDNNEISEILNSIKNYQKDVQIFIAQQFLIKNYLSESKKVYRILEDYSSLKFIQYLENSNKNQIFLNAEKLFFLNKIEEGIKFLIDKNKENFLIEFLQDLNLSSKIFEYQNIMEREQFQKLQIQQANRMLLEGKLDKGFEILHKNGEIQDLSIFKKCGKFEELIKLSENIKEKENMLKLSQQFIHCNLIERGAGLLEKLNQPKEAVDLCILNNHWGKAVEISEKNNFLQIENLLGKFLRILEQKNKKMEIVQLLRKAGKNLRAAQILNEIAEDLILKNKNPLFVKKVFILSALEINLEKKKIFNPNLTSNLTNLTLTDRSTKQTMKTLNTLITSDLSNIGDKIFMNPWKGAEAWHLYIMAIKYLQQKQYKLGFIVSGKLLNYKLELGEKRVLIFRVIFSYHVNLFEQFALGLSQLRQCYSDKNIIRKIDNLVLDVFKEREPVDEDINVEKIECIAKGCQNLISEFDHFCNKCGSQFGICMVSGKSIFSKNYYKCLTCKHKLLINEIKIRKLKFCSLCHCVLEIKKDK